MVLECGRMAFDRGADLETYGCYEPLFIRQAFGHRSEIGMISPSFQHLIRGADRVV